MIPNILRRARTASCGPVAHPTGEDHAHHHRLPPTRPPVIRLAGPVHERHDEILTPEALDFLAALHHRFSSRRADLLHRREKRQQRFSLGENPDFLPGTAAIRADPTWRVAGSAGAPGLEDRRVEITGPTDRKMTINALNSSARVWLADFEDATSPTWANVIGGQINLLDAIRGRIVLDTQEGKHYELRSTTLTDLPTIVVRPRGWHLPESHLVFTDDNSRSEDASGSLVDFGLYMFHNAHELIERGRGPYVYLPKLESHLEARLWDEVFSFTEERLGLPHGTIRATVLIETLPAAFEMEEILYELRDHIAASTPAAGTTSSARSRCSASAASAACCPTARASPWRCRSCRPMPDCSCRRRIAAGRTRSAA